MGGMTQTPSPVAAHGYRGDSLPIPPARLSDLDDVLVMAPELRRFADPSTWAYDSDQETVALECESCEATFEVSNVDEPENTTNGDDCPECGRGYTTRVIAAVPVRPWWFLYQLRP
jgi:hypothetical protein